MPWMEAWVICFGVGGSTVFFWMSPMISARVSMLCWRAFSSPV